MGIIELKGNKKQKIKNHKFKISDSGDKEWVNSQNVPLKPPIKCKIPENILIIMRTIEKKMKQKLNNSLEFGCFLQGELKDNMLIVKNDISIVKQDVTSAFIDFKEEPDKKYNGVIHRHPNGCSNFSSTDDGSINNNYLFSLLYHNNNITAGIINIKTDSDFLIQLPLKIEIMYPIYDDDKIEKMIEKIKEKEIKNPHKTDDLQGLTFDKNDSDEDIYVCPLCNHHQQIDAFPINCEQCGSIMTEMNCYELDDVKNKLCNLS